MHWPNAWVDRDIGLLRMTRWDSLPGYERVGILWWKRNFPEGGNWAGGKSKNRLPDLADITAINGYIRETRRAEWVHWISCLSWLPTLLFATWWIVLVLAVLTIILNGIPIAILRYNRKRLYGVIADLDQAEPA